MVPSCVPVTRDILGMERIVIILMNALCHRTIVLSMQPARIMMDHSHALAMQGIPEMELLV